MTQRWDPDAYAVHARFVSELGEPVADLLAPQPGERILDVGCGDGALTEGGHVRHHRRQAVETMSTAEEAV